MTEPNREDYEAAERLVREAHAKAETAARAAAQEVPENGWNSAGPPPGSTFPDLGALLALLDSARSTIPPELARQLADALRDLLVAIRAILDYSIDRLDRPPRSEPEVEDIPIR